MMRSARFVSVVVRHPKGDLGTHTWSSPSLLLTRRSLRFPFIRGIIVLYESLILGSRALMISAGRAGEDGAALTRKQLGRSVARSLGISIMLFFVFPAVIVRFADGALRGPLVQDLSEGALRIGLVLAFLGVIGRMPAIRRVFQYHGAEHKAVNAFEMGIPLEAASIRKCSRFHARCGTSFLLVVLLVATMLYALLGHPSLLTQLAERVLVLPLVGGISYEIIRLGQRFRALAPIGAPGIWLQRLTTLEPEDLHLEVAIKALREVLDAESVSRMVREPTSRQTT